MTTPLSPSGDGPELGSLGLKLYAEGAQTVISELKRIDGQSTLIERVLDQTARKTSIAVQNLGRSTATVARDSLAAFERTSSAAIATGRAVEQAADIEIAANSRLRTSRLQAVVAAEEADRRVRVVARSRYEEMARVESLAFGESLGAQAVFVERQKNRLQPRLTVEEAQQADIERRRAESIERSRREQEETRRRVQAEADALVANGARVDPETGRIRTSTVVRKPAPSVDPALLERTKQDLQTAAVRAQNAEFEKATPVLRKRIGLLMEGTKYESTKAAAMRDLLGIETRLTATLQQNNLTLQQRVAIERQLERVRSVTKPPTPTPNAPATFNPLGDIKSVGSMVAVGAAGLALTSVVFKLTDVVTDSGRAFDEFEASQRKLEATAKLTGRPLEDLNALAKEGVDRFQLGKGTAAAFAAEVSKLAQKAGQTDRAKQALEGFLEVGAAQGMTATATMKALHQAMLGVDDGTDKLFQKNPQVIWKEYADSIGKAVGKLTEAEKAQALMNAAITAGARVQGAYQAFLDSAAGKAEQMERKTEDLKVEIGRLTAATRELYTTSGTGLIGFLATVIEKFNNADAAGERFWKGLVDGVKRTGIFFTPREEEATAPSFRRQGPPNPNQKRTAIAVTAEKETDEEKAARIIRDKQTEAEKKRIDAITREISALQSLGDLNKLTAADLNRVLVMERALNEELKRGNLTRERRAEIESQKQTLKGVGLDKLDTKAKPFELATESIRRAPFTATNVEYDKDASGNIIGSRLERIRMDTMRAAATIKPVDIKLTLNPKLALSRDATKNELDRIWADMSMSWGASSQAAAVKLNDAMARAAPTDGMRIWAEQMATAAQNVDRQFEALGGNIAQSIGSAISATASGGFKEGARVLAGATGNIMSEMGQALLTYGLTMQGLLPSLANPFLSGPAAIAAGVALLALGGALGGSATGKRTGVGANSRRNGSDSMSMDLKRVIADPNSPTGRRINATETRRPAAQVQNNTYVFPLMNPNDPASQRLVAETMKKGGGRGL